MKLVILIFAIVFESALFEHSEGDLCTFSSSGTNGICKLISACPSAVRAITEKQVLPQICRFKDEKEPIVCCIDNSTLSTSTKVPSRQTTEVGDKSKQKCQEYGKYVYEEVQLRGMPRVLADYCPSVNEALIPDGNHARSREFPHMALIGFDGENNTIHWGCSGTLISEKFVLSVAHCTYHREYLAAKHILLGELVLHSSEDDAKPQQIAIKNIIRHPHYRPPSKYHDIALFELERNAVLDTYTRPACLNTNPSIPNRVAIATGWDTVYGDNRIYKFTFDIVDNAECNHTYRRYTGIALPNGIVEETQLCAGIGNNSKDKCERGSGGALQIHNNKEAYCTFKVIGVTSFGQACLRSNIPQVYTRVSAYIKWIEDIVWP